jgi:hypothetical protein
MNMKRGLVFTLCALAVAASASSAMAQNVQLSLNLRYTDPADPSEGGQWYLVAKTDDTDGIAGISAYISGITAGAAGSSYGNGAGPGSSAYAATTAAMLAAITNGGNPYKATFGTVENIVYGQDTANGPIVADVGQPGGPGNTALDPLKNPTWNNAAIIATGTFGGTRPAFVDNVGPQSNNTDANTLVGTTLNQSATNAATTYVVRGDSVSLDGLARGDANRDRTVSFGDFSTLQTNYGGAGTWDQGDFNDDGQVSFGDFSLLQTNYGTTQTPPAAVAAAAIPEPATFGMAILGIVSACSVLRKRVS